MPFPAAAPPTRYSVLREGSRFTVNRLTLGANEAAPLPPLCVKCGATSAGTLKKSFYWHSPFWYVFILLGILPYAILAMIVRRRLDVQIPLCAGHRRSRRNAIWTAWLLFLGGIALPIVLATIGIDSPIGVLGACVGVLAAIIIGFAVANSITPTRIDDNGGTFRGAGEGFLETLP